MSYAKHSKLPFDCSDVFKYFHEPQNVKILLQKATHGLYVSSDYRNPLQICYARYTRHSEFEFSHISIETTVHRNTPP